jgi:hypothetical protein
LYLKILFNISFFTLKRQRNEDAEMKIKPRKGTEGHGTGSGACSSVPFGFTVVRSQPDQRTRRFGGGCAAPDLP